MGYCKGFCRKTNRSLCKYSMYILQNGLIFQYNHAKLAKYIPVAEKEGQT